MDIAPMVEFRLSGSETALLRLGFRFLNYILGRVDCQDEALKLYIRDLWDRLFDVVQRHPQAKSHRFKSDALGLAIFIFLVRCVRREKRRGRFTCSRASFAVDVPRLLPRLEKHRKRAKRLWLSHGNADLYRRSGERWRRFLATTRGEYKGPVRKGGGVLEIYKSIVNSVMRTTAAILAEENEPCPTQKDLRQVVRQALRHVRRERACVWIRDLLILTARGREFLASFCIRRLREIQQARRQALLDQGIDFDRPGFLQRQPKSFVQELGLSDDVVDSMVPITPYQAAPTPVLAESKT